MNRDVRSRDAKTKKEEIDFLCCCSAVWVDSSNWTEDQVEDEALVKVT